MKKESQSKTKLGGLPKLPSVGPENAPLIGSENEVEMTLSSESSSNSNRPTSTPPSREQGDIDNNQLDHFRTDIDCW